MGTHRPSRPSYRVAVARRSLRRSLSTTTSNLCSERSKTFTGGRLTRAVHESKHQLRGRELRRYDPVSREAQSTVSTRSSTAQATRSP
jgi:hypothetical protein